MAELPLSHTGRTDASASSRSSTPARILARLRCSAKAHGAVRCLEPVPRWFGEGHWFVGIGNDAGGIFIRDSSGWDNRYLIWSRLYGEAGFSGWVVGVAS